MLINKSNFYILCTLKPKTIIPIGVYTKTSKLHKPSVGRDLFWSDIQNFSKSIYRDGSRIPTTSETLPPVTLVKRLKAVRK